MENKQLYKISKYTYNEIFLDSQLQSQGANQARFLESLEKNSKAVKTQDIVMKFSIGIMMCFLAILPIQAFLQIDAALEQGYPIQTILFAGSISLSIFFVAQISYLILFGMFLSASLMGGELFIWLQTLPLSKSDLRKIAFFTFFRGVNIQFIILIVILPVVTGILTQNLLLVLITIGISVFNILFSFSLLVLMGEKMHRVMSNYDVNSPKATFMRIMSILSYGLGSLVIVFIFQIGFTYLEKLFLGSAQMAATLEMWNPIMALIPVVFSVSYLITAVTLGTPLPATLWINVLLGCALFILLSVRIARRSVAKLGSLTELSPKEFQTGPKAKRDDVELIVQTPIKAFIKKDLSMATRDYQMLMLLIMPAILPLIGVLSVTFSGAEYTEPFETAMMILSMMLLYLMMGALMLIGGLLNVETTGTTIIASLPTIPRDQAVAKIRIMIPVLFVAGISSLPFFIGNPMFWYLFSVLMLLLPVGPIFILSALELKVLMFGKLKYKFVLEEVQLQKKVIKWIILVGVEIGIYIGLLILCAIQLEKGLLPFAMTILPISAIVLFGLSIGFNKIFPRKIA
jgi:hypothetical protein